MLVVAKELLADTGSIFVQIGDENLHLVRSVLDEVFGAEKICGIITVAKTAGATSELLPGICDYILWYAKDRSSVKYRPLFTAKTDADAMAGSTGRAPSMPTRITPPT